MIVLDFLRITGGCILMAMVLSLSVIFTLLLPIIAVIICVARNVTLDDGIAAAFKCHRTVAKVIIEICEAL